MNTDINPILAFHLGQSDVINRSNALSNLDLTYENESLSDENDDLRRKLNASQNQVRELDRKVIEARDLVCAWREHSANIDAARAAWLEVVRKLRSEYVTNLSKENVQSMFDNFFNPLFKSNIEKLTSDPTFRKQ